MSLQDALKERSVQSNYCPYGNLHMTLAFIGESYDLTAIRKAMANKMAWMLKKLHGVETTDAPEREDWAPMNFIR